ncbi:MAG TPA: cation:proton antiporter, partial [Solirubrobacteraceae bacterium]
FTMGVMRGLGEAAEPDANRQDRIEAIAFGIFVPFFFVATGLRFDVGALFESVSSAIELPIFLVALLAVHVPVALVYRRALGDRAALAAGFMQATSLTFVVVAAQLGVQLHAIDTATAAALVGAALLSVVVFPAVGLGLLGRAHARESVPATR